MALSGVTQLGENLLNSWAAQTTTDTYADLGSAWDKAGYLHASIIIKNEGDANSADVKVLGSVDGGQNFDAVILAETTVAAGDIQKVNISDYYTDIKIQVKSTAAASTTDVSAKGAAISL